MKQKKYLLLTSIHSLEVSLKINRDKTKLMLNIKTNLMLNTNTQSNIIKTENYISEVVEYTY